jgi:hypothetical protein
MGKQTNYGLWPSITDEESARKAAKQGVIAAGFVAVITALFATISMAGTTVMNISAWAYIDAVIFAAIAFGIYKMSRTAAVLGLLLYLLEKLMMLSSIRPASIFLIGILIIAFVNSVRGTFAYHRIISQSEKPPEDINNQSPREIPADFFHPLKSKDTIQ